MAYFPTSIPQYFDWQLPVFIQVTPSPIGVNDRTEPHKNSSDLEPPTARVQRVIAPAIQHQPAPYKLPAKKREGDDRVHKLRKQESAKLQPSIDSICSQCGLKATWWLQGADWIGKRPFCGRCANPEVRSEGILFHVPLPRESEPISRTPSEEAADLLMAFTKPA